MAVVATATTTHTPSGPAVTSDGGADATRPTPEPGSRLESGAQSVGRFALRGKLGAGAFGTVYRAYDPQLDREVALKVPHASVLDSPKRVERFLREAKAAANLRHPHVVPVYDAGKDGTHYYIASAYVEGRKLADAVEEAGEAGLAFDRAARLTRELAEALAYAHSQGVVHRDVKPDNVVLDVQDRVHLMDFGLAARQDEETSRLTSDGAVMGTPAYMSPEQARGQKGDAQPATDQYAAGVVLYELLTGRTPFGGPPAVVIAAVLTTEPDPPHKLRPDVPKDLETICLKAMAKKPDDRYASCRELADDLRRWLEGEPIIARRMSAAERFVRWSRKNRAVAGLTVAVAASLLIGTVVASVLAAKAEASATRAADERTEADRQRRIAEGREREAAASATEARAAERAARQSTSSLLLDRAIGRFEIHDTTAGYLTLAAALEQCDDQPEMELLIRRQLAMWRPFTPELDAALDLPDGTPLHLRKFEVRGDGRQVAVCLDKRVDLLPLVEGGPPPRSLTFNETVFVLAYSPDGRFLAAANSEPKDGAPAHLTLWDLTLPGEAPVVFRHPRGVSRIAFLSDGRVATVALDQKFRVWERSRPSVPQHERRGPDKLVVVQAHADGKRLLLLSQKGDLTLWEPGGSEVALSALGRAVTGAAVSSDGSVVAHLEGNGLRVKTRTGEHHFAAAMGLLSVTIVADRFVTAATPDGVHVWDVRSGHRVCHLWPGLSEVKRVLGRPDGRLISVSQSSTRGGWVLRVWNLKPAWAERPVRHHPAFAWSVTTGRKSGLAAWGTNDGTCEVWNLNARERVGEPLAHGTHVTAAAISPDETRVLTGALDGKARMWEAGSEHRLVWECASGGNPSRNGALSVWAVAFGRDGKTAYFGGSDRAVHSIDVATGKPIRAPISIGSPINAVAVGPDDEYLIVGCETPPPRRVQLRGAPAVQSLAEISVAKGAAVSADGRRHLFTTWAGYALVFDTISDRPIGLPLRHRGGIWRGSFSPDEVLTATASIDGTVRLWDTASGRPVGPPIAHANHVTSVAFTAGGGSVLSTTATGEVDEFLMPSPVGGRLAEARRQAEFRTGSELLPDGGVRTLNAEEWRQRRGGG